ncbi:hypothetical protein F4824DRAFT_508497 [Ustulina deusta]|nr:hypothetical protein F4824DRAFT_508497 [Ustulina deusta]
MEANRVLTAVQNFEHTCRLDFTPPEKMSGNRALLEDAVDQIRRLKEEIGTQNTPGSFHICTAILDLILAIGNDAMKAFQNGLDDDSYDAIVRDWIARCKGPRNNATAFKAKADLQPRQAFGVTMPGLQWENSPNSQTKLADSQQLLEKKAQLMLTMKLAMEAAKRDYDTKASRAVETEGKLTALTASLAQLVSSQGLLEKVNKLLRQAIKAISQLQNEVRRLVSYFHAISETIRVIVITDCDYYLNLARTLGENLGDRELFQSCADELFHALVGLRGDFAVVYANARFYQEVSNTYITRAMHEVCSLPIDLDMAAQIAAQEKLEVATNNAAERVRKLGLHQCRAVQASLESGIKAIETEAQKQPGLLSAMNKQQAVIREANRTF